MSVRDELSLVGADGADLLDVLYFHVAITYCCSGRRRVDVSLPWYAEDEPSRDCRHHGTTVEDRGGIVRACCDVLRVSSSADVVVVRLLVILLWRRGASCVLPGGRRWRLKAEVASPRLL